MKLKLMTLYILFQIYFDRLKLQNCIFNDIEKLQISTNAVL